MKYKSDQNYYKGYRTDVLELIPESLMFESVILEIGGGDGSFSLNFDSKKEYWLVEPNANVASKAGHGVTKTVVGIWEEVKDQLPNKYFDLIICNDVIEHMPGWRQFLRDVQRKMKNTDSCLIGSIPNVRVFTNLFNLIFRRDWEYMDSGVLDSTHYVFFTSKSLKRELSSAGYKIKKFKLMKKFKYSPEQSRIKYFVSLLLVHLLGRDSRYGQLGFCCSIEDTLRHMEIVE